MSYFACCSVSVVGKTFNDNRNAVRTVALVNAVFVVGLFAVAGSLLDKPVNVVVGYVVGLCLLYKLSQLGVASGVAAALLYRYDNFTADFCENLGSCAVLFTLFSLDI